MRRGACFLFVGWNFFCWVGTSSPGAHVRGSLARRRTLYSKLTRQSSSHRFDGTTLEPCANILDFYSGLSVPIETK
jgi:hypothetical protein